MNKKQIKRTWRKWTDEEIKYLEKYLNRSTVKTMAKNLNRSISSVSFKLDELGIGYLKQETGKLTARELAEAINVDTKVVIRWIRNNGLKAEFKAVRTSRKFFLIDTEDFWEWASENKDRINFYKIEPLTLLPEPDWVDEQRRHDFYHKPKKRFQKWTRKEELKLLQLINHGEPYRKIAHLLGRTEKSIRHKASSLKRDKIS